MQRAKVMFFMPSLNTGGAERVTLNLIRALCNQGEFALYLAVMRREGALLPLIPDSVPIIDLGGVRHALSPIPLVRLLQRFRPDVVYSVTDGPNLSAIMASLLVRKLGIRTEVVGSLHTTLSQRDLPRRAQVINHLLIPLLYPQAKRLVAVSDGIKADYISAFPVLQGRIVRIWNAAFDDSLYVLAAASVEHPGFRDNKPVLVACGRLIREKGFHVLLDAMSIVRRQIDCRLMLLGDGPERQALEQQAHNLGISADVQFLGFVDNPYAYMARATLFVHSSLRDGLPTSLIEAMACGVPVVATDCPSGPREILGDEPTGFLVTPPGDAYALAKQVLRALSDRPLSMQLAQLGKMRAQEFHAANVVRQYADLFRNLTDS